MIRKLSIGLAAAALGLALIASGALAGDNFVLVDLIDWFNNDGISWNEWPGDQNLDGGGWGLPAEELPDGDFEVLWDQETVVPFFALYKEDGWGNNVEAEGQTIDLPEGNYKGAWILAANHHGATEGAPIAFNYSDGTATVSEINAGDWCGDPVASEKMVLRPSHRHDPSGDTGPSCGIWLLPMFELDAAKTLVSVTLPDEPRFHVFGITLVKAQEE